MSLSNTNHTHTALIAGASGLVGSYLLKIITSKPFYQSVKILSRKPSKNLPEGCEEIITNFQNIESIKESLKADHVYCCLGTTMKKAGSKEAFRKVDYDYPLELARVCNSLGIQKFSVITALGSDAKSMVFYNRVKGELENQLKTLGIPTLNIFRPSLIEGDRKESRPGEMTGKILSKVINPLLMGGLKKYRSIHAEKIALAMYLQGISENNSGFNIFESDEILRIAEGK